MKLKVDTVEYVSNLKELVDGDARVHLSITDQSDYCAAMVVVEKE